MKGTLYWITGLSGAGKTTSGKLLYEHLKRRKDNVVLMDGDTLRVIRDSQDYSLEGRKRLTYLDSLLFKELTDQGIDVVACVISMFDDCRQWNKQNIENYKEIYLHVPIEELIRRDQKKLYSRAIKKEIRNVMGIDLEFEAPKCADIVIENYGENNPYETLKIIIKELNLSKRCNRNIRLLKRSMSKNSKDNSISNNN